jgi:Domain of unknown function (DUF1858)
MSDSHDPPITPAMKVGQLLEAYPQLEEKLISLSPQFKKLRNPLLRRTVAKVVTLQQAAATGQIPIAKLVNTLRREAGQPELQLDETSVGDSIEPPGWMNENRSIQQLDVTETINAGGVPMQQVLDAAAEMDPGRILELIAPLRPSPIEEKLRDQGFESWCQVDGEQFHVFFLKR